MDEDEEAWRARLATMFPAIERWAERTRTAPVTPQAGSSLAADDRIFPAMPPSHLAYAGIVTATEHLELFREAFQATGKLYPAAYFTLLRTALMGSAQAVWLLKPAQRIQRQENALRIVRDDIKQRMGLLSDETPAALGLDEKIEEATAKLRRHLRAVHKSVRRRRERTPISWPL
jgi:hypothetical protein